jgi:phosphate transport system protein
MFHMQSKPFMPQHFLRALDRLNQHLLWMPDLAIQAVRKALQALQERNLAVAREVIAGDSDVDSEDNSLNEECLKLIALHHPVACDLRRVTAAMMLATDLERIGDLAEAIAERAIHLAAMPASFAVPAALPIMAEKATAMLHASMEAFAALDVQKARAVCRADDEVDRLNDQPIRELIDAMKASPDTVEAGVSLFSVVRHLERVADHATNIAEDVVYLAEGNLIRHHPEALAE